MPLTARQAERRLMLLTALRWIPVGVTFGLTVLLPLERGLTLTEVGVLLSVQGFVVLGLELPTGGLADTFGRRPVLVIAGVIGVLSTALFVVADGFVWFAAAILLQGVFRALDSGPLEAWFVDAATAVEPDHPLERTLSRAGTVLGLGIAGGALAGGGLVTWAPVPGWSPLVLPFLVALAGAAGSTVATALLVTEPPRRRRPAARPGAGPGATAKPGAAASAARPAAPVAALRLLRRSPVLRALIAVEVFWAIAMVAFESLTPVRLAKVLGGEDAAGALFGPASAAAWALFAAGAFVAGRASRRIGVVTTAMIARVLNGAFVVAMGVAAGPVGLLAAYGLAYLTHGSAGPLHNVLLHREADAATRATVLSANSMVAGGVYSVGLLVLLPLAEGVGTGVAIIVAGAFSILGALCYLPARRAERGPSPA